MKVAILFGSDTGKTAAVALRLQALFPEAALFPVTQSAAADLAPYDTILVGTSTWGTGSLPESWNRSLSRFPPGGLQGKTLAFFGLGDRVAFADTFCQAVTTLRDRFGPSALRVLDPPLLLDDDNTPDDTAELTAAWARRIKDAAPDNR